nr:matrilysin-like isoform X2 [Aedes albopictus]
MEIAFGGRRHTNRESICDDDLGANTLAHAYYPQIGGIHFNTQFFHAAMDKDQFFTTAMHEIGHALGLEHSVSKASLMYPTAVAHFSEVPSQDVQMKYGKRQGLKTTGLPTFCEVTKYDAMLYYQNKLVIIAESTATKRSMIDMSQLYSARYGQELLKPWTPQKALVLILIYSKVIKCGISRMTRYK